jgi:hypothetical protein
VCLASFFPHWSFPSREHVNTRVSNHPGYPVPLVLYGLHALHFCGSMYGLHALHFCGSMYGLHALPLWVYVWSACIAAGTTRCRAFSYNNPQPYDDHDCAEGSDCCILKSVATPVIDQKTRPVGSQCQNCRTGTCPTAGVWPGEWALLIDCSVY